MFDIIVWASGFWLGPVIVPPVGRKELGLSAVFNYVSGINYKLAFSGQNNLYFDIIYDKRVGQLFIWLKYFDKRLQFDFVFNYYFYSILY